MQGTNDPRQIDSGNAPICSRTQLARHAVNVAYLAG